MLWTIRAYPPCSVEINRMLSFGCISYSNSPSNSQSVSFTSTKIPGRTDSSCMNNSGRSVKILACIHLSSLRMVHFSSPFNVTCRRLMFPNSNSAPALNSKNILRSLWDITTFNLINNVILPSLRNNQDMLSSIATR